MPPFFFHQTGPNWYERSSGTLGRSVKSSHISPLQAWYVGKEYTLTNENALFITTILISMSDAATLNLFFLNFFRLHKTLGSCMGRLRRSSSRPGCRCLQKRSCTWQDGRGSLDLRWMAYHPVIHCFCTADCKWCFILLTDQVKWDSLFCRCFGQVGGVICLTLTLTLTSVKLCLTLTEMMWFIMVLPSPKALPTAAVSGMGIAKEVVFSEWFTP